MDDSAHPIIVVRFLGTHTDDEFEGYLARMSELLADSRGIHGLVLDATQAKVPTGRQARMQANWMRDNAVGIRERTVGTAFVLSSPALRGVLKAILMMQPIPSPYRVVPTPEEATAWLRQFLAGAESRA